MTAACTGTMAALSLAVGFAMALPGQAQDVPNSSNQIASVSGSQDVAPFRLGMPPRLIPLDVDLKVLLVQNRPPHVKTDAPADDETILVALALSVPASVDDEIAKQYGLDLIERTELRELDLRIVTFRVAGNKPTGPILAELRNDQRIRRAQYNVQYGQPSQGPPAISRLNGPPEETKPEIAPRQADRKSPAVAKVAQKLAEQVPTTQPGAVQSLRSLKSEPLSENAQPLRVGRVGDVLSGGL